MARYAGFLREGKCRSMKEHEVVRRMSTRSIASAVGSWRVRTIERVPEEALQPVSGLENRLPGLFLLAFALLLSVQLMLAL